MIAPRARGTIAILAPPILLAVALLLPALVGAPPLNDSHGLNLVWSDQFTAAMRAGDLWPRWLAASYDGLGAPVFYFYGPMAFWIAGSFGLAGLALWPAIAMTAVVALCLSGAGMALLLRSQGAPRVAAGAICFVAAPYHLLDFLRRGALAEFVAIGLLPWLALAIRPAMQGRIVPLAIVEAALIATHLPTAVLVHAFLLPMLVAEARSAGAVALRRIAAALALGMGLAAAYWLPAWRLQPFVDMAAMRTPAMQPAAWRPGWYWQDGNPALLLLLGLIVALALPAAMLRSKWRWFVAAMLVLAIGGAWPIWLVPPLDRVQFPWRVLGLAEFALALAIGHSRIDGARLLAMLAPAAICSALVLTPSLARIGAPWPAARMAALLRHHPDVAEYRPAPIPPTSMAGMTIVRRHAFPIWRVHCAGSEIGTRVAPGGLIAYGGRSCTMTRIATLPERIGNGLSLLALSITLLAAMPAPHRFRLAVPRMHPA